MKNSKKYAVGLAAVLTLAPVLKASAAAKTGDAIVLSSLASMGSDAEGGVPGIVRILLQMLKNLNKDLLNEAKQGNAKGVEKLLAGGAYADARDEEGHTPLMIAAANGNAEMAKILLRYGADPNADAKGRETVLIYAVFGGRADIVKMLLEKKRGANVNGKTKRGFTALMAAAAEGKTEIAKILLEQKEISVNARTSYGWTALRYAEKHETEAGKETGIASLIRERMKK